MTKVSVVIPTYNRYEATRNAIYSVLQQTIDNHEIIVVDDGSTDATSTVPEEFEEICYLRHDSNRGQNVARNTGLEAATGTYISYLDSDDLFLPEHLEVVLQKFAQLPNDVGAVLTGYYAGTGPTTLEREIQSGSITVEDIAENRANVGGLSTLTFRRALLDEVGYHDEQIVKATDLDFYLELLAVTDIVGINRPLVHMDTQRSDNVSQDNEKIIVGERRIIQKHSDVLTDKHIAMRYDRIGRALVEEGRVKESRGAFWNAIRVDPWTWYHYYHLGLSFIGKRSYHRLTRN